MISGDWSSDVCSSDLFEVGDAITASPAISAGRVVVGSTDGRVYCFG